jgi:hypothetical protein
MIKLESDSVLSTNGDELSKMSEDLHQETYNAPDSDEELFGWEGDRLIPIVRGRDDQHAGDSGDRHSTGRSIYGESERERHDWKTLIGTLIMISTLLAFAILYFPCAKRVESWNTLDAQEKKLAKHVIQFFFFSAVGVSARWLTLNTMGFLDYSARLVNFLSRWLADVVSTSTTVTVVLLVAQAVRIQMGDILVALSEADLGLLMGLSFTFGFFGNRARKILKKIGDLSFLRRDHQAVLDTGESDGL